MLITDDIDAWINLVFGRNPHFDLWTRGKLELGFTIPQYLSPVFVPRLVSMEFLELTPLVWYQILDDGFPLEKKWDSQVRLNPPLFGTDRKQGGG